MAPSRKEKPGLGNATASVRRGISWTYGPAIEDTDTLVLTTPTGYFVDLRLPLPSVIPADTKITEHQSYWVFSGQAFNSGYELSDIENTDSMTVGIPGVTYTRFVHAIDSKAGLGEIIEDSGDSMECGDSHVEWGVMRNPGTGREELYKEVWKKMEGSWGGMPVVRVEGKGEGGVVGDAVRVGRWVQGVIRGRDGEVTAGRFGEGGWDERAKDERVPAGWLLEGGNGMVGNRVEVRGVMWTVVEVA